ACLAAFAEAETQVPAIQASATASASAAIPGPTDHPAQGETAPVPATMPPPIPLVSSAVAPLNSKERAGVALSRQWANRSAMPHAGEDGYVRYVFGATLPTVVCAPLRLCNLALQPGEIVNNVNLGDSVRWKITPSISGAGGTQTTHLIIKPTDAGLVSSLDIETNRRTYAVKLVSTQSSWMPLVAFNYPDDAQAQWQAYKQTVAFGAAATTLPTGENLANLQFLCISGNDPSWAPIRAYTDGAKTYIEFPSSISFHAAPALVALADDGSWFSRPSSQVVNYRVLGNRYVVDAALDRAALISGVGGDQERVVISRGRDCR
ncbi:MAG: P-type conjugative transfer protein TrbG, partial [Rhodospirillales bacterium]|nr:P-type conjugative transfer protein TrbG [Rhodospirillales bacterium]